ncbi:NOL4 protein, partial [Polypterus senegalus]
MTNNRRTGAKCSTSTKRKHEEERFGPPFGIMEGDRDMYRQFQDWCLRTYGDSGKTKTVTRKKYDRIVQLLNGSESSSTDNAKFKFWVKSKGFQLGLPEDISGGEKQVLYVPVKTTVSNTCLLF